MALCLCRCRHVCDRNECIQMSINNLFIIFICWCQNVSHYRTSCPLRILFQIYAIRMCKTLRCHAVGLEACDRLTFCETNCTRLVSIRNAAILFIHDRFCRQFTHQHRPHTHTHTRMCNSIIKWKHRMIDVHAQRVEWSTITKLSESFVCQKFNSFTCV